MLSMLAATSASPSPCKYDGSASDAAGELWLDWGKKTNMNPECAASQQLSWDGQQPLKVIR
jgi:hypothetical protein